MLYVLLTVIILAVLILGVSAVMGYFGSGSKRLRTELTREQEINSVALTALADIASGAALPLLVASEAIRDMTKIKTKELS